MPWLHQAPLGLHGLCERFGKLVQRPEHPYSNISVGAEARNEQAPEPGEI